MQRKIFTQLKKSVILAHKKIGFNIFQRIFTVVLIFCLISFHFFSFPQKAFATTVSDDFNRTDGGLGSNWTTVAGTQNPAIVSSQLTVGADGLLHSAYWSANSFGSDQFAQAKLPSNPNGPGIAVRLANSRGYILWKGNGANEVSLWRMDNSSSWTQIAASGSLTISSNDVWKIEAVGSNIVGYQNGTVVVSTTDNTYTGGSPGVWLYYGVNQLDDWSGGDTSFSAYYVSTDGNGVKTYNMISAYNGNGIHTLRVLEPTGPAAGVVHSFLYALPVEAEGGTTYGDGLETLRGLDAHNAYNATILAPSFYSNPWYADHPTDSNYKYESFMVSELQPWAEANLATSGNEQHWLLGFSKSGFGPIGLLFRNPSTFTLGAFWDFPALSFTVYDRWPADSETNYGTDANFQSNYRLTDAFVEARKTPFLTHNRFWISGYQAFEQDVSDFDALLTTKSVVHTYGTPQSRAHTWSSGWVPGALAALSQNSLPVVTAFSIPTTASSLTVDVTTFTASDSVSVAGYKLTETPTAPSAGDSGWTVTAPTSYTFSSEGSKTLYAWVKNAAGNVSASASDTVTITLISGGGASSYNLFTNPHPILTFGPKKVILSWKTQKPATYTLNWAEKNSFNSTEYVSAESKENFSHEITGLRPSTLYSYTLDVKGSGNNKVRLSGEFKTLSESLQNSDLVNLDFPQNAPTDTRQANPTKLFFTKPMRYLYTDPHVKLLQVFLNSDSDTKIASFGPGSPEQETEFFGILTKKAVIKFQEKYATDILKPWGLQKGTGIVGKTTLAKINELIKDK